MNITIIFQPCQVPCNRCGQLDGLGGVRLVDDQRVSKVLCHRCVINLVRVCLPNDPCVSHDTISAPQPVALAS